MSTEDNDSLQAVQETYARSKQLNPEPETFTPILGLDVAACRKQIHTIPVPAIKRAAQGNQPLVLGGSKFSQASSCLRNLSDDGTPAAQAPSLGIKFTTYCTAQQDQQPGSWDTKTKGSFETTLTGTTNTKNDVLVAVIDDIQYYQDSGNNHQVLRNAYTSHEFLTQEGRETTGLDPFDCAPEQKKQEDAMITTLQLPNSAFSEIGNTPHAAKTASRTGSPELKSVPLKRDLIKNCFRNLQLIESSSH